MVVGLFLGCETQEDFVKESGKKINTETVSFETLFSKIQNKRMNAIGKNLFQQKSTGNLNRSEEDFIKDIDTTTIEKIEIEGKESYTLRIVTEGDTEDRFYNMVVYENDGVFYTNYIRYDGIDDTKEGAEKLINSIKTAVDENGVDIESTSQSENRDYCFTYAPMWMCNAGCNHSPEDSGYDCNLATEWYIIGFYEVPVACNSTSPSNTPDHPSGNENQSGNTNGYPTTNQPHGGSGGTNTSGNPVYTVPVLPKKTAKEIKLAFLAFLNDTNNPHPNELAWWNTLTNKPIVDEIVAYLTDNQAIFVEEQTPFDFAVECITQIIQNPTVFTSFKPFVIEKQIDDSQLDPCNKNIMNQLKNLQQADIAKIFAKLNNPNMVVKPYYSTKIVNANPTNPDAYASTNWVAISNPSGPQPGIGVQSPFNYVINVRPAYLDGTMLTSSLPPKKPTQLSIARTLLHEIIHAYFDSLFDDCHYYNNCSTIKDFSELWSDYEHFQLGTTNPVTDPQHLAIANNFVNILACALQEFQTGVSVTNASQDFKDLAWFGLQGNILNPNNSLNPIFNLEYPLGSNKRIRFEAVNTAEDFQQSSYNIVPNIHPKSTPCN